MITIFFVIVLIFSVIIHEISHGYVALLLGDTTAKDAGRLTLNPLAHIDLFGSVIFPLALALMGAPVFGYAKPVPYNPMRLRDPKRGAGLIALAGPGSNVLIAIIFAIISRVLLPFLTTDYLQMLYLFVAIIVQVNIALAIFNLLPIPPLDGSGILFSFLPRGSEQLQYILQRYGFFILLILIFSGLNFLNPIMDGLYRVLLGAGSPLV
jgi:Zn-dependent protease